MICAHVSLTFQKPWKCVCVRGGRGKQGVTWCRVYQGEEKGGVLLFPGGHQSLARTLVTLLPLHTNPCSSPWLHVLLLPTPCPSSRLCQDLSELPVLSVSILISVSIPSFFLRYLSLTVRFSCFILVPPHSSTSPSFIAPRFLQYFLLPSLPFSHSTFFLLYLSLSSVPVRSYSSLSGLPSSHPVFSNPSFIRFLSLTISFSCFIFLPLLSPYVPPPHLSIWSAFLPSSSPVFFPRPPSVFHVCTCPSSSSTSSL